MDMVTAIPGMIIAGPLPLSPPLCRMAQEGACRRR